MKIDHLINGKSVASSDYFETANPATQEVLAEVASGGEAEVHAAVAAANAAQAARKDPSQPVEPVVDDDEDDLDEDEINADVDEDEE